MYIRCSAALQARRRSAHTVHVRPLKEKSRSWRTPSPRKQNMKHTCSGMKHPYAMPATLSSCPRGDPRASCFGLGAGPLSRWHPPRSSRCPKPGGGVAGRVPAHFRALAETLPRSARQRVCARKPRKLRAVRGTTAAVPSRGTRGGQQRGMHAAWHIGSSIGHVYTYLKVGDPRLGMSEA
jgi:hypothetical protein